MKPARRRRALVCSAGTSCPSTPWARAFSHRQGARAETGRRPGGRAHRRNRGLYHRRSCRPRLSRHDPAQSRAVPRTRARLCLSRLWNIIHAQRLERGAGRRRGRLDQGDRADDRRRDHASETVASQQARDLARGPGRLCEALEIDRRLDGIDLCQAGPLWLGSDGQAPDEIGDSVRIGITRAPDSRLRFYVRGNRFVSGPQALNK